MKAKDTVIGVDPGDFNNQQRCWKVDEIVKRQAQISFKAGIKEVVEWLRLNSIATTSPAYMGFSMNTKMWQAKLKEWGI